MHLHVHSSIIYKPKHGSNLMSTDRWMDKENVIYVCVCVCVCVCIQLLLRFIQEEVIIISYLRIRTLKLIKNKIIVHRNATG